MYEAVRQEDVNLVLANIGQHHVHLLERVGPSARSLRRFHPSASPPPRRPVGARERSSRGRPGSPRCHARRMHGDPHPWRHPWRPQVACNSQTATGTSWAGSPSVLRRRAPNAPDQVDQRRAVHGRDLAGHLEADARGHWYRSHVAACDVRAGIPRSRTAVAERRDQGVGNGLAAGPFLPDGRLPAIVSYQLPSCSPPPPVRTSDLTQIIDVIEKHREKREDEDQVVAPLRLPQAKQGCYGSRSTGCLPHLGSAIHVRGC